VPTAGDLVILLASNFFARSETRPKRRVFGDNVPAVDVIITSCKEDVSIVMDTVKAAMHLDWPQDKLRVIVSDDGADADLEDQVHMMSMNVRYTNLVYFSRIKTPGRPHGFKAGNMNAAMAHLDTFARDPAQWVGILDADMIPDKDWLRALMPHALIDRSIGMMTIPQVSCTNLIPFDLHLT
jgi:cellulose synthase/poly-beta-1,6-N-acetylglucosamine synthase-like glycosyltransferase